MTISGYVVESKSGLHGPFATADGAAEWIAWKRHTTAGKLRILTVDGEDVPQGNVQAVQSEKGNGGTSPGDSQS